MSNTANVRRERHKVTFCHVMRYVAANLARKCNLRGCGKRRLVDNGLVPSGPQD